MNGEPTMIKNFKIPHFCKFVIKTRETVLTTGSTLVVHKCSHCDNTDTQVVPMELIENPITGEMIDIKTYYMDPELSNPMLLVKD